MSQSLDFPDCFYRVSIKALIQKDGRFLLGHKDDIWESLGGGLDFGESPDIALRRELREETGLSVLKVYDSPAFAYSAIVTNRRDMDWYHNFPVYYRTEVDESTFNPNLDFKEIGWFSVEEIRALPIFRGEVLLADYLEKCV